MLFDPSQPHNAPRKRPQSTDDSENEPISKKSKDDDDGMYS